MREQRGVHAVPRRASRTVDHPANPHYAGHEAGIHPEDQPYQSGEIDEDEYYSTRVPVAVRRYTGNQQIIQQGNRRLVIHHEPPPSKRRYGLLYVGVGMLLMIGGWIALAFVMTWWNHHQLDSTYGMPRTYQVDAVVGHSDSTDHPTHFTVENLHGHIVIVELPGGDISHARIYAGPTLFEEDAASVPATLSFQDVNGDGKVDMVLHIGNQEVLFLNDGTQFKPQ